MSLNDSNPNHSSSDDDEEEEETSGSDDYTSGSETDEVSDTDSGEKPPPPEPKQTLIPHRDSATKPPPPPVQPPSESESESESGSETDSDSDPPPKTPAVVNPSVKTVSLKLKDGSKTVATSKRPAPEPAAPEKESKKGKLSIAKAESQKTVITPSQAVKTQQTPDLSSSEGEESDSGTDSDSPPPIKPTAADPSVKPAAQTAQKKKIEIKLVKKDGSSKAPAVTAQVAGEKEGKKDVKVVKSANAEEDSKKLFQRLWSEDDEIVILQGMIDYMNENGESSIADMGAFYEVIKKSLHVDVSRAQLVDKVRRLKNKYVNNASKDRHFSKSHDQKGYELSKLIWGTESKSQKNGKSKGSASSTVVNTGTAKAANFVKSNGLEVNERSLMEVERKMDVSRFVQYGGRNESPILTEEIVKAGMELVGGDRRVELEEKWRKLKEQELLLYVKRMDLVKEQALLVLEAIGSSGN